VHRPRPQVPRRAGHADELSPAPDAAAGDGRRARWLAARAYGIRRGRARPLPILQLRRRDADPVTGVASELGPVPSFRAVRQHESGARLGRLVTAHGVVDTPAFMPVATHGSVKGVTPAQLEELGATIVLSNAYHLAQRPGVDVVRAL